MQSSAVSRLTQSALNGIIAPVRKDYDAVNAELNIVLTAEIPTAHDVSTYVASNKGKGLRQAIVLLAAACIGEITPAVRYGAAGVELLQTSTLLHDDVIDESPLRRGKPSVNARWGNEIAVLMGDALLTQALRLLVLTGSLAVMDVSARQTRELIEGEIYARDLRATPDFAETSYIELIRRKTGALMALAAIVGSMLGGGTDGQTNSMREYGYYLGMAFQIADDLLDVMGDPRIVGKPTGQDLRDGTVTLPLIRAIAAAPENEAAAMREFVRAGVRTDSDWLRVREFIDRYDGIRSALATAHEFSHAAQKTLTQFTDSPARRSMIKLLDYVIDRQL